ncbi:hypothetical protein SAMN05421676_10752 [Salinibacillus kushneri]|uniref:Uncharacterized protein n=1 Tax=Salinibacillus kushneri TaxID=237682 RepID=A0A1I0GKC6_9BACI|nr:hypothetical protein [Salinibacillus kushneri]SET71610.1 hypothetical protein SAMN05421676_10752 [Salinibacillus kushneri]
MFLLYFLLFLGALVLIGFLFDRKHKVKDPQKMKEQDQSRDRAMAEVDRQKMNNTFQNHL